MSKFKFKFSTISNIKEKLKSKTQKELAEINLKIDNAKQKLEETRKEILENKVRLSGGKFKMAELHYYERHGLFLATKLKQQKKELDLLMIQRKKKLNELILKTKEQKMFELLEKKHYENFLYEELKKENKMLDEIAIQKLGRK